MAREFSVQDSIDIDASPEELYAMVSDVTRMGEWSPENTGGTGTPGTSAVVGTVFDGHNSRGSGRWVTRCTVTAADPGRRFAFTVHSIGFRTPRISAPIASWEYRFEPLPSGGTRVTEQWTDDRRGWPTLLVRAFDAVVTLGHTFADYQRGNIRRTLRNLKRVAEQG